MRTVTLIALTLLLVPGAIAQDEASLLRTVESTGLHGGLCVQVGGEATASVELADTGRFLVHVLLPDVAAVKAARAAQSGKARYGLLTVSALPATARLPYTENLVNLLILSGRQDGIPALKEVRRALSPTGLFLASPGTATRQELAEAGFEKIRKTPQGLLARNPWNRKMDEWTHPRHSASGNAVSRDTEVAPPRRIRWVAAAQSEVAGMVSSGGRNFYSSALARDGFNGLRLWNRDLVRPSSKGEFVMRNLSRGMPPPVATEKYLFAVSGKKLMALEAGTGKTVRVYEGAGEPTTLLHDRGLIIAADARGVHALDVDSAEVRWSIKATDARNVVVGDAFVGFVRGRLRRGEKGEIVAADRTSGKVLWSRNDFEWAPKISRAVAYRDMMAFEVSTLNDDGPGNALHILSAKDGKTKFDHEFLPGMNHRRQARAMFIGDRLWILHGGKDAQKKRIRPQVSSINFETGDLENTFYAGLAHCFPPVATPNYIFAGELDLTDLKSGKIDAHQITKAACGRDSGWIPANGLVYITPKHCICWPMLRGYVALAPEAPGDDKLLLKPEKSAVRIDRDVDPPPATASKADDWPMYRHDAWRSGSTKAKGPASLDTIWESALGSVGVKGPIKIDWDENPYIKGPISAPVIANDVICLARPDAHEVVLLDRKTGKERWRHVAGGRVDTAPTLHRGLVIFGSKDGRVTALRASDGNLVWSLTAAPNEEQIVAYGQLESPWPVPGSVAVIGDRAYFAAGRQSLADGGILVFSVEAATGAVDWVTRLDSVPQKGFYRSSGLEFDNFDLLHREGKAIAMSRWMFDRASGKMSIEPMKAFARQNTGGGTAMIPQGTWSYAPRHQRRVKTFQPLRSLVVFRDKQAVGCLQDKQTLFRRDFDLEDGENFNATWMTGWSAGRMSREGKMPHRTHRMAEKAAWKARILEDQEIVAMVLADDRIYVAGSKGALQIRNSGDGTLVAKRTIPAPLWDGLAVAGGKLYVSTRDGKLLCLGK